MLHIIGREQDASKAANCGGATEVFWKTFKVELPEVEAWLNWFKGQELLEPTARYNTREIIGVEVVDDGAGAEQAGDSERGWCEVMNDKADWEWVGCSIEDGDGNVILKPTEDSTFGLTGANPGLAISDEHRDFIIRACNAHGDLLAACKALVRVTLPMAPFAGNLLGSACRAVKVAEAAIAKAEPVIPSEDGAAE